MQALDVSVAHSGDLLVAELGLDPLPDQALVFAPATLPLSRSVLAEIPIDQVIDRRRCALLVALPHRVAALIDEPLEALRFLARGRHFPVRKGSVCVGDIAVLISGNGGFIGIDQGIVPSNKIANDASCGGLAIHPSRLHRRRLTVGLAIKYQLHVSWRESRRRRCQSGNGARGFR
jgi:hypothetical protein